MIIREINNVKIAVNPKKANQVFLSKKFLSSKENNQTELSPTKICKLISRDLFTPMLMTWELLDKCNFSCSFCYIVWPGPDIFAIDRQLPRRLQAR